MSNFSSCRHKPPQRQTVSQPMSGHTSLQLHCVCVCLRAGAYGAPPGAPPGGMMGGYGAPNPGAPPMGGAPPPAYGGAGQYGYPSAPPPGQGY